MLHVQFDISIGAVASRQVMVGIDPDLPARKEEEKLPGRVLLQANFMGAHFCVPPARLHLSGICFPRSSKHVYRWTYQQKR